MASIDEHLGRVLSGRYRLMKPIASGASAHVYAATDVTLKRTVAVKLLHPGFSGDKHFSKLLLREAHAVASLNHPNIVQVYDCAVDQGSAYLVLEYLGGGSLASILDAGVHLDVSQACSLGLEVAQGLAYAHRRGFIHRDIKPANILFTEDGVAKIADFGLAQALAASSSTEPVGGQLATARYASPEQAEGMALDARSDVYSLAIVLYEAVTGRVPFVKDTTLATLTARIGAILPKASELGPLMPILAQAAISEPLARLDSGELVNDLELLKSYLKSPAPLPIKVTDNNADQRLADDNQDAAVKSSGVLRNGRKNPENAANDSLDAELIASGLIKESASRVKKAPDSSPVSTGGVNQIPSDNGESVVAGKKSKGKKIILLVIAVVLVAGAAGGYYDYTKYHRYQVVPSLGGKSYSSAENLVRRNDLRVEVSSEKYSTATPSGFIIGQSPKPGTHEQKEHVVKVVISLGHAPVEIPQRFAGEKAPYVMQLLVKAGLKPFVISRYENKIPADDVVSLSPSKGKVKFGSAVKIIESKGPAPRTIPPLAGDSWSTASLSLSRLGLVPVEITSFSYSVASGEVISTTPADGTKGVLVGSKVTVNVSKGPLLVAVPTVSGMTIKEAIAAINNAGLQVTEQVGPPFATTASTTSPAPGTDVRPGTSVTLYVS